MWIFFWYFNPLYPNRNMCVWVPWEVQSKTKLLILCLHIRDGAENCWTISNVSDFNGAPGVKTTTVSFVPKTLTSLNDHQMIIIIINSCTLCSLKVCLFTYWAFSSHHSGSRSLPASDSRIGNPPPSPSSYTGVPQGCVLSPLLYSFWLHGAEWLTFITSFFISKTW